MKIIVASNNKGKILEIKEKLKAFNIEVLSLKEANIDIEIEETGTTFAENAILKARTIYKLTKTPVLADDSGLEVDCLDGKPGVYSHRFAGPDATDEDRINKILELMTNIPDEKRSARFRCSICYIDENGKENLFDGTVEGKIGYEPKGNDGFGYDPIFVLESGKTFAQISQEDKNKISHRGKAINKFAQLFIKHLK